MPRPATKAVTPTTPSDPSRCKRWTLPSPPDTLDAEIARSRVDPLFARDPRLHDLDELLVIQFLLLYQLPTAKTVQATALGLHLIC